MLNHGYHSIEFNFNDIIPTVSQFSSSPGLLLHLRGEAKFPPTPPALTTPRELAEHCIIVSGSKSTILCYPNAALYVIPCHQFIQILNTKNIALCGIVARSFYTFFSFLLTKTKYELFCIKTGSEYIMAWQQGNTITFFINITFSCFRIFHFAFFAWKSIKILSQQKDTVI